jgi:MraZ protein
MALFLGEFEHQIDDKGRLSIPARFREQCSKEPESTLAILPGMDPCLYIIPARAMQELQNLLSLGRTEHSELARAFRRQFGSHGSTVNMDTQGRVVISERQRVYAGLERKVMVVGNLDRMEVWDPEKYQQQLGLPDSMKLGMGELASRFLRGPAPDTRER